MWRILNKLFGWQYVKLIAYENEIKIQRCYFKRKLPYIIDGNGCTVFLNKDGTTYEYEESRRWESLTYRSMRNV